ncbi:MAG: phosphoribosylformylglycinamidine synthase subunit PurQ [Myxococcales bacterium]|nr:phosphoribosylformylglycinamidine synthase subunit PurQ [Myxococcales bacterium]
MAEIKAIVVTGNGTNCEMEMAHACRLGGFEQVDIVFIYEILSGEVNLEDYHLLCLPGGFMDGDDLGSAKASAVMWRFGVTGKNKKLADYLKHFIKAGKLILGVCNGFQLLVKLGLLPALNGGYFKQSVTLTLNDSGRFEDRWVHLAVGAKTPCVFLKGLERLYLPVRHGEGKLIVDANDVLEEIQKKNLAALRYVNAHGEATQKYPANPNGSTDAIAGLCDESGRIFGLMPHPEAFTHYTNFPHWQRYKSMPEEGQGVALFRNAFQYLQKNF